MRAGAGGCGWYTARFKISEVTSMTSPTNGLLNIDNEILTLAAIAEF